MVISVVIPSFYPAVIYGGTVFASYNNARTLASRGNEVFVSTTNTNMYSRLDVPAGRFLPAEKNLWVKYYNETVIDKLSLPLLFQVWKDIRRADVVHVQAIFNTPIPLSLLYAVLYRKPVLLSPHGVLGDWVMGQGSKFKKSWLKFFIRPFANRIWWHATSAQEKREILQHFPEAKVAVIPNAIDLKAFEVVNPVTPSAFVKKFGKVAGTPSKIIVSMGRLHKKKGFDILIAAFRQVLAKEPGAMLFIAGSDEGEESPLVDMIKMLGLEEKVFLTGNLEGQDKVDFLGNADLFVLPSRNENFGLVYAEALAAGTPIVASTETPWEEVEEAGCGRWVPHTAHATAKAMLDVLARDKEEMEKKAKAFVSKFSFEAVANEFEKIFTKMIEQDA